MKRILVIEDSDNVRNLIAATLAAHDYAPIVASNGREGIEAARKFFPELVLCDVRMPEMDGFEVLEALQSDAAMSAIPFVFLTGLSDKNDLRRGMESGADDYLMKPFTISGLLAAVEARLEKADAIARVTEQKLDALRQNISLAIPHEVLTPLNGILGFSYLLEDHAGDLDPAQVRDYAADIRKSGERLHRLIKNFILYVRLELNASQGGGAPDLPGAEKKPAADRIAAAAAEVAESHERTADLRVEIEDVQASTPGHKIEKIVHEILDNAFKFSEPGSPVRVRGSSTDHGVMIDVFDRGRGMTKEDLRSIGAHMQFGRKIFEQQGTGLGLAIARKLAEFHGGAIELESEPEKGTRVRITLP